MNQVLLIRVVILFYTALLSFSAVSQERYDIVISEIMFDPSPTVGLPDREWIELTNTSLLPINLQGWRIADESGQSGTMPNFILEPDSAVIICTGSAVAELSVFGNAISVTSFPSLHNDGELIYIKSPSGETIHAVRYATAWHENNVKKDGGWTLEMIDLKNPCSGKNNWTSSIHPMGGTPGKANSVKGLNRDDEAPQLLHAFVNSSNAITLVFNEPLDSSSATVIANYTISNSLSILQAICVPPLFEQVTLTLSSDLIEQTVYTLSVNGISDCKGNSINNSPSVKVGIAGNPQPGEWCINEILFNPRSGANDYIEFFNNSAKIFDASKLMIANRSSDGSINAMRQLSPSPFLIFPNDYIVVTTDADNLALNYLVLNPQYVLEQASLPSYPNTSGTVLALDYTGNIIDEVNYSDKWHFALLDNVQGIALERIDPNGSSQEPTNWQSAASTAGYGTPTYQNSQYKKIESANALIEIQPKTFSPDGDGYNDVLTIQYKMEEPNYLANITIFDANGRPVKNLVRNGTMTTEGYWNWNGLDDKNQKLPIGTYIVYTEVFNLNGKKKQFKNAVVLARRW